ncbi:PAAR domain-containing protein [Paraburkholderia phenazinium]|uniref:Zn-binding Pro-Ala-Ala-Arg (PAAR) domain-containing protein, incolved in TypeVI secretion n=1 Tax=Paraburkholderia phenazinium TaxID=60549 RepID=A0A1G7PNI0_9BURK|nr:PAAR domain-containing protein [Paraburkholderia phenazinium]SDF86960.1 Zn-binding Pro-Ala-Ala-Arg (PAAR) domain-containing protein, incolved in TypeVI secretion [Paraburkholderia phenazinium]
MTRRFICVGDKHSHGGNVVSGASQSDIDGKAIARVGDSAICKIHGSVVIVSGDENVTFDGKAAAREGDRLSCDAILIAQQQSTASE